MTTRVHAQRVDDVPQTASVTDYDQLGEAQQRVVRQLAAGDTVEDVPLDRQIVRFVDYYRIERTETASSRTAAASD